jgi:hypothetical protein
MKATVWKRLVKTYILPEFPDARLAGSTVVVGEVGWILHALVMDTSSFNANSVRISAVNQPLYVPIEGLILTFGEVLRHPSSRSEWRDADVDDPEALAHLILEADARQARSVFEHADTPASLADYSERRYPSCPDPPTIEVEAYSWALAGNSSKFRFAFERLARATAELLPSYPWVVAVADRARLVQSEATEGMEGVERTLGRWRDDSIRQHKLEKLTTPYASDHW